MVNKAELADRVSKKTEGISKKDLELIVTLIFETITEALADRETVSIVGFGKFEAKEVKERLGRNPQTGEPMTISKHMATRFKAGERLKTSIN